MKKFLLPLIFVGGALAGALANRWCGFHWRHQPPKPEEFAAHLAKDLSLDQGQRTQVRDILVAEQAKIQALHSKTRGDFEALRKETHARLNGVLKPEQQAKFDALSAKWEACHKKDWGGPGGPPSPPEP